MTDNPGTGKTHLSIALGLKSCLAELNVRFYTAANLSNHLIEALDNHRLLRLENQIAKWMTMFENQTMVTAMIDLS